MIFLGNLRQVRPEDYDEVWAIVRSMKEPIIGMIQVQALSPDWPLFRQARALMKEGKWNRESFETFYRPRFLVQMEKDPQAQALLEELSRLDRQGKRIALVCFCQDENLCHRSLVGKLLEKRGVSVQSLQPGSNSSEQMTLF